MYIYIHLFIYTSIISYLTFLHFTILFLTISYLLTCIYHDQLHYQLSYFIDNEGINKIKIKWKSIKIVIKIRKRNQ